MQSQAASEHTGAKAVAQSHLTGAVRLVELDIPFGNLVVFFCECALAAIPAALMLWLLYWISSAFIAGAASAK